jgi:hypothetical protein
MFNIQSDPIEPEDPTVCCRLVPVAHLALDVDEPLAGWPATLAERGVELVEDDLGRASVPRQVLGDLLA